MPTNIAKYGKVKIEHVTWAGLKKASGRSSDERRLPSSFWLSLLCNPMFISASKCREKATSFNEQGDYRVNGELT